MIIVLKNYTYTSLSELLVKNITNKIALWIPTVEETIVFGIFNRKYLNTNTPFYVIV